MGSGGLNEKPTTELNVFRSVVTGITVAFTNPVPARLATIKAETDVGCEPGKYGIGLPGEGTGGTKIVVYLIIKVECSSGITENRRHQRTRGVYGRERTAKGRQQLVEKTSEWQRLTRAMGLILDGRPGSEEV